MAIGACAAPPFDFASRQAAGNLAFLHAVQGETHEAQRWIEREAEYGDNPGWLSAVVAIPAQAAQALTALDRLDVEAAVAVADSPPDVEDCVEYWSFVEYS